MLRACRMVFLGVEMHRIIAALLGATALAVASVSGAFAADMAAKVPMYSKAPMAAPAYSWTGFYVGGNVGGGWRDQSATFAGTDASGVGTALLTGGFGGTVAGPASISTNGITGGLQAGYNWQFNQSWLIGGETDFNWSNFNGTGNSAFNMGPGFATNIAAQQRLDSFGTVRARLGVLPTDRLLVYGTGGFAYGRIKENVTLTSPLTVGVVNVAGDFNCTAGQTCFAGSSSRLATGWTAGFGTEYAFSSNITAKVEYAYVNLGGGDVVNVVAVTPTAGNRPSTFSATYGRMDFNVVRVGLNYKF
jgi:outer membrane immunogenic protein